VNFKIVLEKEIKERKEARFMGLNKMKHHKEMTKQSKIMF